MKKGILIVLLSALAGGLTAFAVVKSMSFEQPAVHMSDGPQFRTVNLSQDNWPDFTFAAESAVDAVVYVKVTSTQTIQQAPNSIFDFFFGFFGQFLFQSRTAFHDFVRLEYLSNRFNTNFEIVKSNLIFFISDVIAIVNATA